MDYQNPPASWSRCPQLVRRQEIRRRDPLRHRLLLCDEGPPCFRRHPEYRWAWLLREGPYSLVLAIPVVGPGLEYHRFQTTRQSSHSQSQYSCMPVELELEES